MMEVNDSPQTKITVESRKQYNDKGDTAANKTASSTSSTKQAGQTGDKFDFTAHMKSIRPTFNRFGQHEPATVSKETSFS